MTSARPAATGAPGYAETMPCEPESARRARLLVSVALHTWGIGELAEDGQQIVAELFNNTINHTRRSAARVVVTRPTDSLVRIGVADNCREAPGVGSPGHDSEEGRGLILVEALSWRWGYDRKPSGKVVWAELKHRPHAEALSAGTADAGEELVDDRRSPHE
ncbi:ATP-binding protein [Streptomyces sp. NPDC002888]|uniref:ATP-binding protein n=1 Tax=Streptomyces sp. NPDC002888 TaxID=3364668 RepID=UPI00368A6818